MQSIVPDDDTAGMVAQQKIGPLSTIAIAIHFLFIASCPSSLTRQRDVKKQEVGTQNCQTGLFRMVNPKERERVVTWHLHLQIPFGNDEEMTTVSGFAHSFHGPNFMFVLLCLSALFQSCCCAQRSRVCTPNFLLLCKTVCQSWNCT